MGHNVPAEVSVGYFDGTDWQPATFVRQIASQEWAGPTGQAYGSLEDRYRFAAAAPEPGALALVLLGCGLAAAHRPRRRRRVQG